MRFPILAGLTLSLVACAPHTGAGGETEGARADPPIAETCPIIESGQWHAWVDRNHNGGGNVLQIRGRVTTPTPDYSFSWKAGPTDRALPPGQRVALNATPPDGIVAQVLTEHDVSYSMATPFIEFRTIIIGCGDTVLHEFGKVTPLE